jgi:anti-sigma regulatory factor (Ser/Thr protein kinase)
MEHARLFPASAESVPEARRWSEPFFEQIGAGPDGVLVVSELVTNAVQHGSGPVHVRIVDGASVRIEVTDARPVERLEARDPDPDDPRGRGLFLVEALADAWGVADAPNGGKVVWAEFGARGAEAPDFQHPGRRGIA